MSARPWPWLDEAERVDVAIYATIARSDTPTLDRALRRLSRAADYSRLSLGSAAVLSAIGGGAGRRAAVDGLASLATTATIVNAAIKPLARRRRPDHVDVLRARRVPMPRTHSFPSGHTASAFAFATGVADTLPSAAIPLRVLATVVGYSRIHTGVHYPADVAVGALLGVSIAQMTTWARRRRAS